MQDVPGRLRRVRLDHLDVDSDRAIGNPDCHQPAARGEGYEDRLACRRDARRAIGIPRYEDIARRDAGPQRDGLAQEAAPGQKLRA